MLDSLYILAAIFLICVGITGGWYLTQRTSAMKKNGLRTTIAIVVTFVWFISILAEILVPGYTVSILIHGIMGAVVGYLFSEDGLTINIGGE